MAYELSGSTDVNQELQAELSRLLTWIEDNVDVPNRFNRTKSKGWYRRETRAALWPAWSLAVATKSRRVERPASDT
jgi:hypothetical protein